MWNIVIRVLYVEDDEDDYILIKRLLAQIRSPRYEVEWAKSYEEALDKIGFSRFDACLLDYRLGECNGLELLSRLIKRGFRAPVILLTSAGDHATDIKAMEAGAVDFLVKAEVTPTLLERSLRYAIGHKRMEEDLRASIAECKLTEEALRRSEERFRLITENSRDLICIADSGGYHVYVSPSYEKVLGHKPEAILGHSFLEYLHPDDLDRMVKWEECPLMEFRMLNASGDWVWMEGMSYPISLQGEQFVVGVARDISSRKKAEEALMDSERQLRILSGKLLTAQEEERKTIAREIHDSIGSSLTTMKFGLEAILAGSPKSMVPPLASLISLTQRTLDDARRIMTDLRPSILDDLGLPTTVVWFCREYQTLHPNITVQVDCQVDDARLSDSLKTAIFRIIQEAFNNVAKHSRAEWIHLILCLSGDRLDLHIQDNGIGFDVGSTSTVKDFPRGIGLSSMRERAELSQGTFTLLSSPGKGTTIRVSWEHSCSIALN